jgi:hypothetical protein
MRPDDRTTDPSSDQLADLPQPAATDASPVADQVKGGGTATTTTSNMLKTNNDTQASIIANMK